MKETLYTIGQVSEMFGYPISTLRYYDRQGLIPNLKKINGIRKFDAQDLDAIRVIECLKSSGLEIDKIRLFMELCTQGNETLAQRKELFEQQKVSLQEKIDALQVQMAMVEFKCWYYETACRLMDEEQVQEMIPDELPDSIRSSYDRSHTLPEQSAHPIE